MMVLGVETSIVAMYPPGFAVPGFVDVGCSSHWEFEPLPHKEGWFGAIG